MSNKRELTQAVKNKARQLGFILAGVTSCEPPKHFDIFQGWLDSDHHGMMDYLASERSRQRRADPSLILPECESILVLALPYQKPDLTGFAKPVRSGPQIASYALGNDYHDVIPPRLKEIVQFIEEQVGHPVPNRCYTDTGPILERELAQRAGLGWIGKNSMLINPKAGSTFLLAEILLGIELERDEPFPPDHCGTCTRCIEACPTDCILPNRTVDSRRCISYLTIENKDVIPEELRPQMGNWIFGCDICQQVCPWNRFSLPSDPALEPNVPLPVLSKELTLTSSEFNRRFKRSPIQRAKRRGYLRNLAVALGNAGNENDLPLLEQAAQDDEALVREHAKWAVSKINKEIASASPRKDIKR
ncbi:MAG: tRNA epoxyqueuosine(34) reductase QueG [Anaerolineales bacterium]|nr:tRNA epoxyqueuosine(34) reductase QueG [Anaerolineales bacterium]